MSYPPPQHGQGYPPQQQQQQQGAAGLTAGMAGMSLQQGQQQQQQYPPPQQQQQQYPPQQQQQYPPQQQQQQYPPMPQPQPQQPQYPPQQQQQQQQQQYPPQQQQQQYPPMPQAQQQPPQQQPVYPQQQLPPPPQQYQPPPPQQYQQQQQQAPPMQQQATPQQQPYQQRPVVPEYVTPANPRHLSMTVEAMPSSKSLQQSVKLTHGVVIQPMAEPTEEPLPVVNFGAIGVVRCQSCRAYINPYVTFVDGGSRWRCNICYVHNEVQANYFSQLDEYGTRMDVMERPELNQATYEVTATAEYCMRNPMPPTFVFCLDVSRRAVESGMLAQAAHSIRESLDSLPGDGRTLVGFITFNSTVQFHSFRAGTSAPQAHVMPDVDDVFLPMPADLLVNLAECRDLVDLLLDSLPGMHADTLDVESALGPALEAATHLMAPIGGKLQVFLAGLPSLGVGRLQNRENPAVLGTAQEHLLLQAASDHYRKKAIKLTRYQVSVDLFLFAHSYLDVATVAELSRFTGGQALYYPSFSTAVTADAERLDADIRASLAGPMGWESVIRVRVSKGVSIDNFHGNFFIRGSDLLALPCVDANKAFAMELKTGDKPVSSPVVGVQAAVLYTTSAGERRIRVINAAVPVTSSALDLYAAVNSSAYVNLLAKQAVETAAKHSLPKARDTVRAALVSGLRSARAATSNFQATGGELPPNLSLLPILGLGLLKSDCLKEGSSVRSDERASAMAALRTTGLAQLETLLRPLLLPLHLLAGGEGLPDPQTGEVALPAELDLSSAYLEPQGAYLLDNGQRLFLRLGSQVSPEWLSQAFGARSLDEVGRGSQLVAPEENDSQSLRRRVHNVVNALRARSETHQQLFVVKEGEASEVAFLDRLVADGGRHGMSLNEFMHFLFAS